MNSKLIRHIAAVLAGSLSIVAVTAGTFTTNDGTTHEGELYKVLENVATIKVGDEKVSLPVSDFDGASQAAIQAWAKEHPEKVDVYSKWDVQPRIKSSAMPTLPAQFIDVEFKGMVSVDLVLDDAGQVIHASVRKSTHAELDAPSLEAAKTWIFEPAQVSGKNVKSRLRVPFKFVSTPKVEEEVPAG